MDIDTFEDAETAEVQIKDPLTGTPIEGMFVTLMGPTHPERKRKMFAAQRRARQQIQKSGRVQLEDPAEEDEDLPAEIASIITGWTLAEKGAPIPFSKQSATELLSRPTKRWLLDQLIVARDERERFIRRSAAH